MEEWRKLHLVKKLLFLLLLSPLCHSEVIEFTCDGFIPYQVEFDSIKETGEIKFLVEFKSLIAEATAKKIINNTSIHKLTITEDFYQFHISKGKLRYRMNVFINRKNLISDYQFTGVINWQSKCVRGKLDLSKNII
jgi:hypothetical protein